jgi:hypothetical protein
VLFLYSQNMAEVDALAMARPLLIVLASAVLLTLVLDRVFALGLKAGLIVSLLLVMFFSYGHFYDWLLQSFSVRHRFLLPIWIACWVPLLVMLVRTRRTLQGIDRVATVIAGTAVATSVLTIGGFLLNMTSRRVVPPLAPANITARVHGARLPDIYYIVLDAYAGGPVLRDLYDYDNGAFLNGLERRGFRLASHSRSNYSMTLPSTAATLNMDYLENLTRLTGTPSNNTRPLCALIDSCRVQRILAANGYRIIRIDPPPAMFYRDFPGMLLRTTMLAYLDYTNSAARTLNVLHRLFAARPTAGPTFVYAHVMCPHRPYVFGPHGEIKSLAERMQVRSDSARTRRAYLDQVEFVNSKVDSLVDQILARRDRRTIIILQGDHGPRNYAPMDHPTPVSLREGSAILNAYYLPGGAHALYETISPVNSFRLVFRDYFGLDYPPLADRSFHNWSKHPYQWLALGDADAAKDTMIAGAR